ncbi:MAG: Acetate kinase [Candidatus Anoxychlamydiales bacterium]|uniref:Acetate kinase n=1 Tax=marine sediment metagenome TaxID=412755 RepID=A0A0F9F9G5_9ZZZZ|nr:Acetate kinase [Candidatus Anoxychlamydiales bacterium]NGX40319.1 Acetate kinase [Candidatus Anoxychlamydiales bacterium]HEU64057.1 acetate/propionate family kinase [Chlamydiota bacterium]
MESLIVLNTGSSSIKFSIFSISLGKMKREFLGSVSNLLTKPHIKITKVTGDVEIDEDLKLEGDTRAYVRLVLHFILDWAQKKNLKIIAAGHRVVHGGNFEKSVVFDDKALAYLKTLIPFSPLHQPYNLNGYLFFKEEFEDLFQVATFDSAFHSTCDKISQSYALPKSLTELGIRRYGFHGLSYEYIASQLPNYMDEKEAKKKIIVAHLGSGSTMCAIENLKSLATSIGLTSMGGLPMATRPGDVDPYLGVYLMDQLGWSADKVQKLFYKDSGLLGVSGISADMAKLIKSSDPNAKLAVDIFVHRISLFAGSLAAELQGLDGFVFTGGIGENSSEIREMVSKRMSWLGVDLDLNKNNKCKKKAEKISKDNSKVFVYVIPTDEEIMIAKHTFDLYKEHKK